MLTKTQLKILAYVIDNPDKYFGIHDLAREIGSVYYLVHRNIQNLIKENVIRVEKAGRTNIVKLSSNVDESYLIEAEKYKKNLLFNKYPSLKVNLKKIIKESKSAFFILIVFGSYAKKKEKNDSDLDLLIIVPDSKDINIMEKTISTIARTSSTKIHETVIDKFLFKSMLNKRELNVVREAIEKHILIYGDELYYSLVR